MAKHTDQKLNFLLSGSISLHQNPKFQDSCKKQKKLQRLISFKKRGSKDKFSSCLFHPGYSTMYSLLAAGMFAFFASFFFQSRMLLTHTKATQSIIISLLGYMAKQLSCPMINLPFTGFCVVCALNVHICNFLICSGN